MNSTALIVILLAVCALLIATWDSPTGQKKNPAQLAEPLFHRLFGSLAQVPQLKISWSYGYPAFEIAFASKAQMKEAQSLSAAFKQELNGLFSSYGPVDRRFDAEMAVSLTYPGYIDDMLAAMRDKKPNHTLEPTSDRATRDHSRLI